MSQITLLVLIGFPMMLAALWSGKDEFVIVTGLIGTFAFGLAAFGLFNVEVATSSGIAPAGEEPALALFATALALASFWPALTGPVELIASAKDEDEPLQRGGI